MNPLIQSPYVPGIQSPYVPGTGQAPRATLRTPPKQIITPEKLKKLGSPPTPEKGVTISIVRSNGPLIPGTPEHIWVREKELT